MVTKTAREKVQQIRTTDTGQDHSQEAGNVEEADQDPVVNQEITGQILLTEPANQDLMIVTAGQGRKTSEKDQKTEKEEIGQTPVHSHGRGQVQVQKQDRELEIYTIEHRLRPTGKSVNDKASALPVCCRQKEESRVTAKRLIMIHWYRKTIMEKRFINHHTEVSPG